MSMRTHLREENRQTALRGQKRKGDGGPKPHTLAERGFFVPVHFVQHRAILRATVLLFREVAVPGAVDAAVAAIRTGDNLMGGSDGVDGTAAVVFTDEVSGHGHFSANTRTCLLY